MRITTLTHVNARTADGRVYSALEGRVSVFDDNDEGMTTLMRVLAAEGVVRIEAEEPADTTPPAPDPAVPPAAVEPDPVTQAPPRTRRAPAGGAE